MKGGGRMDYKKFRRQVLSMPQCPEVLRFVDARLGVVYVNTDARLGANVIIYIPPCG